LDKDGDYMIITFDGELLINEGTKEVDPYEGAFVIVGFNVAIDGDCPSVRSEIGVSVDTTSPVDESSGADVEVDTSTCTGTEDGATEVIHKSPGTGTEDGINVETENGVCMGADVGAGVGNEEFEP
jgi:hypothetical protein